MNKPELYNDLHPDKSLKNTGYKDEKTAKNTLKIIQKRSLKYQFDVVNTMYNRAKFHQSPTEDMKKAMNIFDKWLKKYPNKKLNEDNKFPFLDLVTIKKYSNLINNFKFSYKSIKFFNMYESLEGKKHKLQYILYNDESDDFDFWSYRIHFIKKNLEIMKDKNKPFFYSKGKLKDLPTKDHLLLILHAYSPYKNI